MKKIGSVLLALMIIFNMAIPAFSDTAQAREESAEGSEQYGIEPMAGAYANETGYDLWLRYRRIPDAYYSYDIISTLNYVLESDEFKSEVIESSLKELKRAMKGMTGRDITTKAGVEDHGAVVMGTPENPMISSVLGFSLADSLEEEGYMIKSTEYNGKKITVIAGGGPKGVLYGTFKLLEFIQCGEDITNLDYQDAPVIDWRVLDQWDNWGGSIERGYAGNSIYKWNELPDIVDSRYEDFARANASIGINTIVINNVNPQADYIKTENIAKVAAIADVFRKYGIRLGLSVRFDSPLKKVIGTLDTTDPLDSEVKSWWDNKFGEIYEAIPDFAGILVKADSEGQPGPSSSGRTHAEGANMFSEIFGKYNPDSVVMWRAFVYGAKASTLSEDIVNQAYLFFEPLDGQFNSNVVVQSKNGPRDFLPIEPVAPLFGGMTKTNMGIELQITQEYTGQSTHVCYLVPQWKYYFDTDMMLEDGVVDVSQGTTLSKIIDGTVFDRNTSLIAGVSNVGNDQNWNRLELAQANWYGFGKLAWNPETEEEDITNTWIKMTFANDEKALKTIRDILLDSWGIYSSYTSPYAMGMTQSSANHFAPALGARNSSGVIKVDASGIGHPRNSTSTGKMTDATAQYSGKLGAIYNNIETCPEELLGWFHHVPYGRVLSNGKTMKQNLYQGFIEAPDKVKDMRSRFAALEDKIDNARFNKILTSFDDQHKEAVKWSGTMMDFFGNYYDTEAGTFENLALGKPATASQTRNTYYPKYVTDGKTSGDSTRWATEREDDSQYIFIDLEEVKNVNRVDIYWENYSMRYVIEVAETLTNLDGSDISDWTVVAECYGDEWNRSAYGVTETSVMFENVNARYVRMRTIEKNSGLWNSIYEFEIYGDDFTKTARYILQKQYDKARAYSCDCTPESAERFAAAIKSAEEILVDIDSTGEMMLAGINELKAACNEMKFSDLAMRKKARRNSLNGSNHAGNAIDGQSGTFWRAADGSGMAELIIDMRQNESFDVLMLNWKSPAQKYDLHYATQDAPDDWVLIKQVERADDADLADIISLESIVNARYVRFQSITRLNELSIYNLEIYNGNSIQDKNRTDLLEVITSANKIYTDSELEKYIPESVEDYRNALKEAEDTYANAQSDSDQLREAKIALEKAIGNLVINQHVTDKYQLINSIKKAEKLNENDFTTESWQELRNALIAAKIVADQVTASQDQIDETTEKLDGAIRLLEAKEAPVVSTDAMTLRCGETDSFMVWLGNDLALESAIIIVEDPDIVSVSNDEVREDGEVTVTGKTAGTTQIIVCFNGGDWDGTTHPIKVEVIESAKEIEVTFDPQGGEMQPQPIIIIEGERYPELPHISKSGYVFDGWFTQAQGGVQVKSGDIVVQSSGHILYAQWTALPSKPIQKSKSSDGGTSIADTDRITLQEREVPLASPAVTVLTEKEAEDLFKKALASKEQNQDNIIIRVINVKTIPLQVMQYLAKLAVQSKVKITIHADTVVNKKVVGRLYITPATAIKDINTTIETGSKKTANIINIFRKYFKNNITVVELDQAEDFGTALRIAVKEDISTIKNPVIYLYNEQENKYTKINTGLKTDNAGYVYLNTKLSGSLVISDGELVKK